MNKIIIAFEGACLSGKTTLIKNISIILNNSGFNVYIINEYTTYAGGYSKFPPLFLSNYKESINSANFFLDLERKRYDDLESIISDNKVVILVDRLMLSCLAFRFIAKDYIGYNYILSKIKTEKVIKPDLFFFLKINFHQKEYIRRLGGRIRFKNDHILYDYERYESFFIKNREINKSTMIVTNYDNCLVNILQYL